MMRSAGRLHAQATSKTPRSQIREMAVTYTFLARHMLRGGSALRALALMGAGVGAVGLAAPVMAQDFTTGSLAGIVVDQAGQPVAGGTAVLRSDAQGFTRNATFVVKGIYRVPSLPVGTYTVTITSANGDTVTSQIAINAGASNSYTFRVGAAAAAAPADGAPATAGDEIVVVGTAERGNDFGTTTGGLNLGNVTNLSDFVTNRVNNIQKALSGQEFVTRLQRQGLSQGQAQATQTAIVAEAKRVQQQATETAAAAARIARKAATTAAWGSLLAAGLVIAFATLGGNQAASTRRKIEAANS